MKDRNDSKENISKKPGKVIFRIIIRVLLFVIIIVGGLGFGILAGVTIGCVITTEPVEIETIYSSSNETVIYDSDDNVICTLNSSTGTTTEYVTIDQIPEYLQHAVVAIEDERFYTHNGVDIKRTGAAVLGFFIPGMSSHGGSTITQQLVKNLTGDDARSVPRKIREQWRAIQLEQEIGSKDKILELYLNKIYFANSCYGIESAAQKYFGVSVSELNLAQCAFLAGIPNSPAKYNPMTTSGRQNAYKRQIIILDNMLAQGYITEDEYIEAIQTELTFYSDTNKKTTTTTVYSYFVDMVIKSVREDLVESGYTTAQANDLIYNQGIKIYSTQDTSIQNIVDNVFTDDTYFPVNADRYSEDCAQAAIAMMDQHTGQIVAIYGGYGTKTQSLSYNRATDAKRQPGSAIKPLLVYGPLIDQGIITAGTAMDEEAAYLDSQNEDRIWPSNWDNYVHGLINVRYALMMSFNIPAATYFTQNMSTCLSYLKKCGIDKTDEPYPSTALGGFKNGVSPLEMCAGYAAIANGGVYYEPICYTKVYNKDNELLLDNTNLSSTIIYEHVETGSIMKSLLESVANDSRSTGRYVQTYYGDTLLPLAGKTGSTTDLKDYWFCGFSEYYTAAVWYGYDDSSSINEKLEGGAQMKIWKAVMEEVHRDLPIKEIDKSSGDLVTVQICTCSGKRATESCLNDKRASQWVYEEIYIKGTEPAIDDYCDMHVTIRICPSQTDQYGHQKQATEWCEIFGDVYDRTGILRSDEEVAIIEATVAEHGNAYLPTDWQYEISHETCTLCIQKAREAGLLEDEESEEEEEEK